MTGSYIYIYIYIYGNEFLAFIKSVGFFDDGNSS